MAKNNLVLDIVNEILAQSFPIVNKVISEKLISGDFVNIFPKTVEERKLLIRDISKLGKIISKLDNGDIYLLNKPIPTQFGDYSLIKVRIFDPTRTERGAPDFKVEKYDSFKKKYSGKEGFTLLDKGNFEVIELKVSGANVRIYFPSETLSESLSLK